jgi:hypothetical protein
MGSLSEVFKVFLLDYHIIQLLILSTRFSSAQLVLIHRWFGLEDLPSNKNFTAIF